MELCCVLAILMTVLQGTIAARHVVYWDSGQISALSTGGLEITLEVDDWMDVLCPIAENNEDIYNHKRNKVLLQLYNVTMEDYADCDTSDGIRLQTCDDPSIEKKLTTKFQERSPSPFGFKFRPGATYYYLSKPLHDVSSGCTHHTMKMKVNVRRKGTVFKSDDHERTLTYHEIHHKKDGREIVGPDHTKKPHRRHHHDRPTPSTTRSPKVIIQYETPTSKTKQIQASAVRQDDPGNGASTFKRPWMITFLMSCIATLLNKVLSNSVVLQ